VNAHLAALRRFELDDELFHLCGLRPDQFHKCRPWRLLPLCRSAQPLLQPRVIQTQWLRRSEYSILLRQVDGSLPERLWQLRPSLLRTAPLIQLLLQMEDCFWDLRGTLDRH
jgi:hypothetical protein